MILSENRKRQLIIFTSYAWAIGLSIYSILSIFSSEKTVSIWGAISLFYFIYKFSVQEVGTARISVLSILLLLFGFFAISAALAEIIVNGNLSFTALIPIGLLHLFLGIWAYQNKKDHNYLNPFNISGKVSNFNIINYDGVRALAKRVQNGEVTALTSNDYDEVTRSATIQLLSEKTLSEIIRKIKLLDRLTDKDYIVNHLKETVNELDAECYYQLYPLIKERMLYVEFFYGNDEVLAHTVRSSLKELLPNSALENMEQAYFENNPCAANHLVISTKIKI